MTDVTHIAAAGNTPTDDAILEMGMETFAGWLEETASVKGMPGEEVRQERRSTDLIISTLCRHSDEDSPDVQEEDIEPERVAHVLEAGREVANTNQHLMELLVEDTRDGPPDTPSGSAAWYSRVFSMGTWEATTLYNDFAQRDTQAFLEEIRSNGQLAAIRTELEDLKRILNQPDTPPAARTYLMPAINGFERELRNLEQGTPAISRTIGFACNLLPAAYTTAVAVKEQDRQLGVTFAASALRGVSVLAGKTLSTLGNTGIMTDHFVDWVLPWFMPPLIHAAPAFVEKYGYLTDKTWFTVVTALGATISYMAPDLLLTKLPNLVRDYRAGAGARLTVAESQEAATNLIADLERDVAGIDATRDNHRVSPAVSRAMVQFKTEMGGLANAFRKTIDQAAASATAAGNVNAGERTMKIALATVAVGILVLRAVLSFRAPLLLADLAGYTAFVALKMFQSALSPHTRLEDTSNSFGGLVATGIPTIIPSIAEIITKNKALENNIGLIVTIVGLAAINLSVGGYLGKVLAQLLLAGFNSVRPGETAEERAGSTATITEMDAQGLELGPVPATS